MRLARSMLVLGVVLWGAAPGRPAAAAGPGALAGRQTEPFSFGALASRLQLALGRFAPLRASVRAPGAHTAAAALGPGPASKPRKLRALQTGCLALFGPASAKSAQAGPIQTTQTSETTAAHARAPSTSPGVPELARLGNEIWQAIEGRVKRTGEVQKTDPNRALTMMKRTIATLERMRRVPTAAAWEASDPGDPALTTVLAVPGSRSAIEAVLQSQLIAMGKLETQLWQARRLPAPQPATVTAAAPHAVPRTAFAFQGLAADIRRRWSTGLAQAFGVVAEPTPATVRIPDGTSSR